MRDQGILINPGSPDDRLAIPLVTRMRTPIPNEQRLRRRPEFIRGFIADAKRSWPDIRVRSSVGGIYNCLGMLFAARRTSIDTDYLRLILSEDGYHELADLNEVEVGDLLEYRSTLDGTTTHVAIVLATSVNIETASRVVDLVLGKWGDAAEFVHLPTDVPPLLGRPAVYWSERETLT